VSNINCLFIIFSEQILQHFTAGGFSKPPRLRRKEGEVHSEFHPQIGLSRKRGSPYHLAVFGRNGEMC
jgi:hypothetical protein